MDLITDGCLAQACEIEMQVFSLDARKCKLIFVFEAGVWGKKNIFMRVVCPECSASGRVYKCGTP